jgi:hypothetical protein
MVPVDSRRIARVLRYSGICYGLSRFRLPGCHRLWPTFPCRSSSKTRRCRRPHNPKGLSSFGLGSSPFARRYLENRCLFLFLQVLRCFSSLGWLRTAMYSPHVRTMTVRGFPIRISPDQSLLAAPRSFSQLSTSFFASDCLGIHHTPFVALPYP